MIPNAQYITILPELVLSIVGIVICASIAPLVSSISLVMGLRALGDSRRMRPGAQLPSSPAAS